MKKRFLALFIVCVMLFAQVSVFANGIDSTSDSYETDIDTAVDDIESVLLDENSNELVVLEEITGLRESNVKHFSLSNGTNKAVLYPQPVHYMDENGNWVDINNSLTLNGNEYSSKNKFEIKFANKSGSNGLLSIKDGEYKIDFTPLNTNKVNVSIENPQENNSRKFEDVSKLNHLVSRATYSNIYNGIDIEYVLIANNIKENIIVNSKQDSYTFSFELKLNKLTAELANGEIILSDSTTGETMYTIPAPYMYDADNVMSTEVEYSLVQNSKWKYTFTVTANSEWINADERAFPVTIDPTIISDSADENSVGVDTHVMSDNDNYFSTDSIIIGNFFGDADIPGFIKFNQLPDIQQGTYLVQAKLAMSIRTIYNDNNIEFYAGIYRATNDWTLDPNFSYATAWSYYDDTPESGVQILETGPYEWDITSLYKDWENGTVENHGICVKAICLDSDAPVAAIIYSIDSGNVAPQLELTYVEPKGIDDDFALLNTPIGDVGNSYVNLFNGNLTYINNITTIETQSLSYEINMVYNSTDNSWIASFDEKITLFENPDDDMGDNIIRYLWHDPDGTIHYFTPYLQKNWWGDYVQYEAVSNDCLEARSEPTVFYPEDDIDYVLTKTPTGDFILKNYNGTQKYFDSNGKLLKICDAENNLIEFVYKNGKLSYITANDENRVLTIAARISYSNDNLKYIYNPETNMETCITFENQKVTSILNKSLHSEVGRNNTFSYSENLLLLESVTETFNGYTDIFCCEYSINGEVIKINKQSQQNWVQITYGNPTIVKHYTNENDYCGIEYTFDDRGRKITDIPYKTSILPKDVFYLVEYSELIFFEQNFNMIKYDIETRKTELIEHTYSSQLENSTSNSEENVYEENSSRTIIEETRRDRERVDVNQEPYKAVCYIMAYYYGEDTRVGTGFLVGNDVLMTAGHILYDDLTDDGIYNPRFPDKVEVYPGGYMPLGSEFIYSEFETKVSSIFIQKEYFEEEITGCDWAVCILQDNVGLQTGYFDIAVTGDEILTENSFLIGYPGISAMFKNFGTIRRDSNNIIYYDISTESGNSGSPVFIGDNNYIVQGIHVSGFKENDPVNERYNKGTKINIFMYSFVTTLCLE